MSKLKTPVIFRTWIVEGDTIALFPTIPWDEFGAECASYQHIGQHDAADPDSVIQQTRPATPEETEELMAELLSIGYDDLVIYKRQQLWMWLARRDEAERIYNVTHKGA